MPVIHEILKVERDNTTQIHLFREGLFLKAYQRSAYLFHTQVKPFRAVKKFYKAAGEEVVMLGFPSRNLTAVFPELSPEASAQDRVVIDCKDAFEEKFYRMWFGTIPMIPEPKRKAPQQQPATPKQELFPDEEDAGGKYSVTIVANPVNGGVERPSDTTHTIADHARIIDKIKVFSLENATPLECMLFLSGIKKDISEGYGRL